MVDIMDIQNALNQAGYGQNANLIQGLLPVTYADNSGFMQDFQEVQGYPNYYVPQQGILDARPVLDAQTPFDPVTNAILNQYGNMESDFQRSFAVNPDTYRGMVYNPAPYTGAFDYGTNTGGGSTDLSSLISAGLLGKEIYDAVKPDDTTTTIDDVEIGGATSTITGSTNVNTTNPTTKITLDEVNTNTSVGGDDEDNTSSTDTKITLDEVSNLANTNEDTSSSDKTKITIDNSGLISNLSSALNPLTTTQQPNNKISINKNITNADALNIIDSLVQDGTLSQEQGKSSKITFNDIVKYGGNVAAVSALTESLKPFNIGSKITSAPVGSGNSQVFYGTGGMTLGQNIPIIGVIGQGGVTTYLGDTGRAVEGARQYTGYGTQYDAPAGTITVEGDSIVPSKLSNFLNTELISGTGGANYLGDLTNVNVGEALSGIGGLLSFADFIDDPNISNTLGTVSGLGGFGLFGSGMAAASPYLGAAALVTGLLGIGQKEPSNYTGYTALDLDTFDPQSFGMGGRKFSQENVDMTAKIMEGIAPYIQEIERKYGVDLKGDLQINYGQRDGLAFNLDNADVTGFNQRLDYNPNEGDISTEVGGDVYRESFSGKDSGDQFITSLLGKIEGIAAKTAAQGGTEYDFENFDASTNTTLTSEEIDALPAILQTQTEERILNLGERQGFADYEDNRDADIADSAAVAGFYFDALDNELITGNENVDAVQQDILVQFIRYAEENPDANLEEVEVKDFYKKSI